MSLIDDLRQLVGSAGVLDADELATRAAGAYRADPLCARALVRPASTEEVSAVLAYCHAHGLAVVTQGGLTGLVHGADAGPEEIILSLERMRRIEAIDAQQRTATVQAGVTLQTLQEAVDAHGLAYPLDLGARGSATLGGNAATNAGGNRVIRYGMTRDMVLGMEVVLADGTVLSSMNQLLKNNTGYDLKQLFIGSEGTLGVITRLVLRLREKPLASQAAFAGLASFEQLTGFLRHMDRSLAGTLSAFEVMWQSFYQLVSTPPAKGQPPLPQHHAFYVLVEAQGGERERDGERFERALEQALEQGLIADAAMAQSEADARAFWALRDDVEQVLNGGVPIGFDVSLALGEMEPCVRRIAAALRARFADAHRFFVFGHLGDGNLHLVVQLRAADLASARQEVESMVYGEVLASRGSISAEHGIGLEKKPWLGRCRNATELALMRQLKHCLDPRGILNPGKLLDMGR